jgi:DNA-binding NtrC family response regulator
MGKEFFRESPILIVDDEAPFLRSMSRTLRSEKFSNVDTCPDSREVMAMLKKKKYSLIFLDLIMLYKRGEELLPQIVGNYPSVPVIILTASDDIKSAVDCMKNGALDYLSKPIEEIDLKRVVEDALALKDVHKEIVMFKKSILSESDEKQDISSDFSGIITQCENMKDIFRNIALIAPSSKPVLIMGETGVGKELIAKAIHELSHKRGKYITVNIGGTDDGFFSDTLFGHKKWGFTDAKEAREGLVEAAANGTLFLDEVGNISMESQGKLLRLLRENEYYPYGSDQVKHSTARIVAATNKDIKELAKNGKYREDLYYRLKTHYVILPPLRERKKDIKSLVKHFVKEASEDQKKKEPLVPDELFKLLAKYNFPGNIGELKNMVYDAVAKSQPGMLSLDVFRKRIEEETGESISISTPIHTDDEYVRQDIASRNPFPKYEDIERDYIDKIEKIYLEELMVKAHHCTDEAKDIYGRSRQTLERRLKKYGIVWGRNKK